MPPRDELRRLYGGDLGLPEHCLYANFVETLDGVVAIPSVPGSNALIGGGERRRPVRDGASARLRRRRADRERDAAGIGAWALAAGDRLRSGRRALRRAAPRPRSRREPPHRDRHSVGVDPAPPRRARGRAARPHDRSRRGPPQRQAARRGRGRGAAGRRGGRRPGGPGCPPRARPPADPERGRPARLRCSRRGEARRRPLRHAVTAPRGAASDGCPRTDRGCRAAPGQSPTRRGSARCEPTATTSSSSTRSAERGRTRGREARKTAPRRFGIPYETTQRGVHTGGP